MTNEIIEITLMHLNIRTKSIESKLQLIKKKDYKIYLAVLDFIKSYEKWYKMHSRIKVGVKIPTNQFINIITRKTFYRENLVGSINRYKNGYKKCKQRNGNDHFRKK